MIAASTATFFAQTPGPGASEPPPGAEEDCPDLAAERTADPTCAYSFDVDACTGDWVCDDGRHGTVTMLVNANVGGVDCGTYVRCDFHGAVLGGPELCEPAPDEPLACPLGDETEALKFCGPFVTFTVPEHCFPF